MSKIKYFFDQARKNIIRNGLMSVASLFTIVSCLVILGLFMVISMNLSVITDQIKDQCEIQVFLDMGTNDERVSLIQNQIAGMDNIKSVELYTKEQMLEEVKVTMFEGKEELIQNFTGEDNPFSDSFKIVLDDINFSGETAEAIQQIENVESVTNKQNVVNTVVSLSRTLRNFTIVLMALLLLVAIVIISNTVRLTVFNRRKEIGIMKYIGATDRFIRIPFIFEGVVIGFIGAVISFLFMLIGYSLLLAYLENIGFQLFTLVEINSISLWMALVFLLAGCLIGMTGSMVSIKKHLRV